MPALTLVFLCCVVFCLLGAQRTQVAAVFVREIQVARSAVLRNNLLIILTDLCVRHTALVDPHMSKLALCLRDDNPLVRQHALTLITNLLSQDYVKWRGTLFFRYLVALVDDTPSLREQARQALFRVLLPKSNFQVCYTHFVEAVFVLNEVAHAHSGYSAQSSCPAVERARFSLAGDANTAKRRTIYRLMLVHCSDEQRFQITARLCEDVLGGVADGTLPLAACEGLLADALHVLASKEIKLSAVQRYTRALAGEELPDDDEALAGGKDAAVKAAAKGKLLSHVVKRNVMQNVVPTMAALKHELERAKSPLLGELMRSLAVILRDYRAEIGDMLASNRQLAAELEFDLRAMEAQEQEAVAEAEAAAFAADAQSADVQGRVKAELALEAGMGFGASGHGGLGGGGVATPRRGLDPVHKDARAPPDAAPGSVLKSGLPAPAAVIRSPGGDGSATPVGAQARASPATPLSIPRLAAPRTDRPEDKGGGARRMRPSVDDLDTENLSVQLAEAEAALLG